MRIVPVPTDEIDRHWAVVRPLLHRATEAGQGRYSVEDAREMLVQARWQLWLIQEGEIIEAAMVLSLEVFPRKRVLVIQFLGGENMDQWVDAVSDFMDRQTKLHHADSAELLGRPGWGKVVERHGWRRVFVHYVKDAVGEAA